MNKLNHILLHLTVIGLVGLWSSRAHSEDGSNPFGGDGSVPPQTAEGVVPPPPTPPPTDGGDFREDDDFVQPGDNFGFDPPPTFTPPPPTSSSPPSSASSEPLRGSSPSPSPSNSGRLGTVPSGAIKKSAPMAGGKSQQKLADYLELDSSVKGLEVKNFDLPDKDIKDVVTLISKWTGKNFILDSKVRGKITILGPSQVTLQEAYQAFLSALEANGLTTVQSGKFIRIIESAEARRAPVETFAGDYAPKTDQFITRIVQLKYINADEVQREFRDLTTRQGKLFAYEPTNSIIITDTGSNIRRIEDILKTIDIKGFETTLHVLKIQYGSAKTIAEMLGEIYGDDKSRSSGGTRSFRRSSLERTRGGGIISKLIPDEATNSLVVLANSSGFLQLRALVAKLDVRIADTGKIHVYYCEYAKAEDLASTLAALSGGGAGGKSSSNRKTSVSTPNAAPGAANSTGLGGGSAGPVTAELEGGVKITSDAPTNSLVITANASDYQTLKRVIRKLDIPRLQVFVETAILEVAIDSNTKIGVNAALGAPGRGVAGGFIGDLDSLKAAVAGGGIIEGMSVPIFAGPSFPASAPIGPNGASVNFNVTTFMGLLSFLTKSTNTSVLSTPQIIALDNEKAEFKVLDEIPVQTTVTTATTTTGATGTIERLKTGIEIKLTPHVNAASKSVRLEIEQKVDSTKANSSVPTALANLQVATTSRVTNTQVVVRDRDFIMLGGLMSDKVDDSVAKVPLLGDIPILGWLFKTKQYKTVKTNLIILLHPRIIGTSLSAADNASEQIQKRDEFIEKNLGGNDIAKEQMDNIKTRLQEQEVRSKQERSYDFRNELTDDADNEPPSRTNKRQESILDTPAPSRYRAEPEEPRRSRNESRPRIPSPEDSEALLLPNDENGPLIGDPAENSSPKSPKTNEPDNG